MRNVVLNQGENVFFEARYFSHPCYLSHDDYEAFSGILSEIDEIDDIKRDNVGRRFRIVLMLFLHSPPRSQAY